MRRSIRGPLVLFLGLALAGALSPSTAVAQEPARQNVISANPFGLLLDLFNAEYERVISRSATIGIGGSMYADNDVDYFNGDVFWRFYPSGDPFDGWAFGVKAGYTSDLGAGFGFDVNRSWLLGVDNNFYVGIGFGLKRIIGTGADELEVFPTIRLVNVGFAF